MQINIMFKPNALSHKERFCFEPLNPSNWGASRCKEDAQRRGPVGIYQHRGTPIIPEDTMIQIAGLHAQRAVEGFRVYVLVALGLGLRGDGGSGLWGFGS